MALVESIAPGLMLNGTPAALESPLQTAAMVHAIGTEYNGFNSSATDGDLS